ncbi:hypothetical protein L6R50_00285 [Myxococcota bacterium]|nr:hypothetical protein [Myxococcota bacterium]
MRAFLILCLVAFAAALSATGLGRALRRYAEGAAPPPAPPGGPSPWLREAAVAFWGLVTWPLGLVPGLGPSSGEGSRPVVLLAGWGHTRASLWPMHAWLVRRGAGPVFSVAPRPLFGGPGDRARELPGRLRAISSLHGGSPVDVVALGTSGLSLGAALAAAPDLPVGRMVGVAVPWQGARAGALLPAIAAAELAPDSAFVREANAAFEDAAGRVAPPLVSIAAGDDDWVLPTESRPPAGAEVRVVQGQGRLGLAVSLGGWRAIADGLGLAAAQVPPAAVADAPAAGGGGAVEVPGDGPA